MDNKHIWDKTLAPGETVKYEFTVGGRYVKFGLITWCIIGGLLTLTGFGAIIGIPIILITVFYYGFYVRRANVYAFTDHRVLVHRGWLSTRLISTDYEKITDVTVHEPFLRRLLFKVGSIEIDTAGTNRRDVVFRDIEAPYEIKKKLDELRGER